MRRYAGRTVLHSLDKSDSEEPVKKAFEHNLKAWWRTTASSRPRGWTGRSRRQIEAVLAEADDFVQALNDRYTEPSGSGGRQRAGGTADTGEASEAKEPGQRRDSDTD